MENINSFGVPEKGIEGKKILEEIVAEKCSYLNSPKKFKEPQPKQIRHKENHIEARHNQIAKIKLLKEIS